MKLWLISQTEREDYDTFDSAVVAAETEDAARCVHPQRSWSTKTDWSAEDDARAWARGTWASSPDQVNAKLIGSAEDGVAEGVILASFNAG